MKSYICPNCGKKKTTAIQWQTTSVPYIYNLETGEYEMDMRRSVAGEIEAWSCPDCGDDFGNEFVEKLKLGELVNDK